MRSNQSEPIAIVGSACRFPGSANTPSKLWELLRDPRDILKSFPPERLNLRGFYHKSGDSHGRTDVQNSSYLLDEDCAAFDAAFFRISPKEALSMDPQQRVLLETVFEALEAAGWPLHVIEGSSTSVHVGSMTGDYNEIQMRDPDSLPTYAATGLARSMLSNRVSYFFDFKGPSITVDTACSSSLVAVHQAIQGLRNGTVDHAVVAGVNLILDPSMYLAESTLHMLSPDSRCRMWDEQANGYARGEGCGVIVLKPLSRAVADHDHIECVIRETAVNSDGRTRGITMPSAEAQASLIKQTYRQAGLDPTADGCQYFECHGTGTQAGDPIEAQAIQQAFFPDQRTHKRTPLYCGSVKTVIGHLEGGAGLAGLLKASLAIQNRTIPPNMHFQSLNAAVEPYYRNLCVPVCAMPWPETYGQPLRASVNSFGFGGTNCHLILESYQNPLDTKRPTDKTQYHEQDSSKLVPGAEDDQGSPSRVFVFSAKGHGSLLDNLSSFVQYVEANPDVDLEALSCILNSKRSLFAFRIAIVASSRLGLLEALHERILSAKASGTSHHVVRSLDLGQQQQPSPRILGVFTGQGAQWATMGRELMLHSTIFRQSLFRSEKSLESLQRSPSWSLLEEIAAEPDRSRVSQAQFSQPMCTAIQIALTDLLYATGVKFDAVVGHSSGEIGAAYAAGILDAKDAMGIAYYRGLVADMAKGPDGQGGSMMAVGMSYADATSFSSQPRFRGRIMVAASNSPTSVTLSGDSDAIQEAKQLFETKETFARKLRVETAYHSHHMLHCEAKYLSYLQGMKIQVKTPRPECVWFSSVYPMVMGSQSDKLGGLKDKYWIENMSRTVLFSQAVQSALETTGPFAMALEIGPHPALKGPVIQICKFSSAAGVENTKDSSMPYSGCLNRASGDVVIMSNAFGLIWSHLGPDRVDLDAWNCSRNHQVLRKHKMLEGLPRYSWNHDRKYWHESRSSRNYRLGQHPPHELLGRIREICQREFTWRNILRLEELPWLRGHMFQGQVVFPGAGYVSMAVQAAKTFGQELCENVRLVEIREMRIVKAISMEENSPGVEVLFTVKGCERSAPDHEANGNEKVEADFTAYACSDQQMMSKVAEGHLVLHSQKRTSLPMSTLLATEESGLPSLDVAKFFSAVRGLGITYEGPFRALKSMGRSRGYAKATAEWRSKELGDEHILHPAVLDVAFQVGFASFISMAENAMGTAYLPAGVRSVVVDIEHLQTSLNRTCSQHEDLSATSEQKVSQVASQLVRKGEGTMFEVDIDVYGSNTTESRSIQIEGLTFKPVGAPLASDDRLLFAKTKWGPDVAFGIEVPEPRKLEQDELEYIDAVERTALFFLRTLQEEIPREEVANFKPQYKSLFRGIDLLLAPVREGRHSVIKKDWLEDTREIIQNFSGRYCNSVDLALLTAVGENLPRAVRGQTEILEHMLQGNLLGRLYTEGRGFSICNDYAAQFLQQISHKFPKIRILEIGAGTGGTTSSVLTAIRDAYVSYTYTDISAGFFEKAAARFADAAHKMEFRTLNAEYAPSQQGFEEGGYDVIIAANVLHATRRLVSTMRNVRTLLKPGGYLVAIEVTGSMLREPGLMGGLEGWWLGEDDGRFPSPGISAKGWDQILHETGFSGIDAIAYDMPDITRHNCSCFITQAIDDRLELLRDPLAKLDLIPEASGPVFIIGGRTLPVSKCIQKIQKLLRSWTAHIQTFTDLEDLDLTNIDVTGSRVLYLAELDGSMFSRPLTQRRLENLQELLASAQSVLWVTAGRRADNPEASMAVGIGRALGFELPHVRMQFLDFEKDTPWDAYTMAQHLLRLLIFSSLQPEEVSQMLWSHEREMVVVEDMTMISRIVMDEQANAQFNAGRRRVERRVGPEGRLRVSYATSPPSLLLPVGDLTPKKGQRVVDVTLSTALCTETGSSWFLGFGRCRDSELPIVFLSSRDESIAHVSDPHLLELDRTVRMNPTELSALAMVILGQYCTFMLPENGTTLILAPPDGVDEFVQDQAAKLGRKVMFVSFDQEVKRQNGWLFVHPLERSRAIRCMLPHDTVALLSFSNLAGSPQNFQAALPDHCAVKVVKPSTTRSLRASLQTALDLAPFLTRNVPEVLKIDSVEHLKPSITGPRLKILDWTQRDCLNVTVPPLDTKNFFAPDKTYLLAGMTGELGQSLCQFMIDCGARNIVLASRNPPLGSLTQFTTSGRMADLQVKMVKMDVTSRDSVHEVVADIRKNMPAIAGVANAALILEDSLFVNTTLSAIERQWQPKVAGTAHLHEEFSQCDLEFFICFSSLASVFGNAGQSIYHAANMFTTSLIERRRRHGQAGSVVHLGMIVDAGYVARSTRSGANIEEHLRSQFYMGLSEKEFHHLILQAVLTGRPSKSTGGECSRGEVTMGIQRFHDDPEALTRPQWYHDPRLSHMILPLSSSISQATSTGGTSKKTHLLSLLGRAISVPEAAELYQELFCLKIESMMKIPASSIDIAAPLFNLGLDSLLAVEIRAWVLKDMRLDVPLFGILSRESVSSICANAAQKLVQQVDRTVVISQNNAKAPGSLSSGLKATIMVDKDTSVADTSEDTRSSPVSSKSWDVRLGSPPSLPITPPSEELFSADSVECVERMSYSQSSMHFLQDYLDDPTTFNVVAQYEVKGPLSVSRFQRALERVIARHDAYRTRILADAGGLEPMQYITTQAVANQGRSRLMHISSRASQPQAIFDDLTRRRWQLARGEAFQCVLMTHDNEIQIDSDLQGHTLFFGCHHIIMDGMSWHIFLSDLDRAYSLLPLEPVPFAYADFCKQQQEDLQSGQLDDSVAFWLRSLNPAPGVMPLLPLSHRRSRKLARVYENHTVQIELAPQIDQQIKNASSLYRVTPMQFCLVTLHVLMVQMVEMEDDEICIGVTDAGRGNSGQYGETVGHFTNLLPIKFPMRKESRLADVMSRTAERVTEAYEHAHIPLDLILEKLQIRRSVAHTPLFQVAFNYRVGDLLHRGLGNCQLDLVAYRDARTPYDLTFNITQSSSTGSQLVEVTTNAYLYTKEVTKTILDMYAALLQTLPSVDKTTRLGDLKSLPFTSEATCQGIPSTRGPRKPNPWPETIIERFREVCIEFPKSVAIKDDTASLTYQDFGFRVHDIAKALRGIVTPGMHVAVLCDPGIDSHATMLAVLWVGAIYIPLDATLPTKRHQAIMEACRPKLLVFHGPTSSTLEALLSTKDRKDGIALSCPIFSLADVSCSPYQGVSQNSIPLAETVLTSNNATCYSILLFTSGSTGTPKGIKLTQAGLMNYTASKSSFLKLSPGVRVLQQSSLGFDMAIAQSFNAFANAGSLIVAPSKARGDPSMIARLLVNENIELTIATPTEYMMLTTYASDLLRQSTSWRYACSGGEAVTNRVIENLQRLEIYYLALIDCYGPTEISCAATFRKIPLASGDQATEGAQDDFIGESCVVGRPIPNTIIYIVDEHNQPLIPGQHGQICIAGCGVAVGYLDTSLNQDKFVQNPFASIEEVERGWKTMYKTGDKGCILPDGSLTFLGRMDLELVKLRGLRIELGEISRAILDSAHGALTDAVVTVRGDPEFLVAHVSFAADETLSGRQDLLKNLASNLGLPRYMTPSFIVPLDQLPMTPSGKVDRVAIASLSLPPANSQDGTTAPKALTVAQGEMRLLWRNVLGDAAISADTDFFTVGGSSLLLVRLQNLLKERMGIQIALHDLYASSTLSRMAILATNERSLVVGQQDIDWEQETAIPSEIQHLCDSDSETVAVSSSSLTSVLLTGATSFLGSEILHVLIAQPDVTEIHCIALPVEDQTKVLSLSEKITVYTGSLLSPTLGLSSAERRNLGNKIHVIIHAGSQGHCLNNYRSVRQANYFSTQFLVNLALPRRIPFHFISSPRVILQSGSCISTARSMAKHPPSGDGSQGFTASKWASERFLERIFERTTRMDQPHQQPASSLHCPLPVVIHRACSLIGDRAPHDDAMNSVLRFSVLSGTVPYLPNAQGFFDFKDIVDVAKDIAGCAVSSAGGMQGTLRESRDRRVVFRHHSSNIKLHFNELAQRLETLHGGKFNIVSMSEWLSRALTLGIEELIVSYLKANLDGESTLMFPYLGE